MDEEQREAALAAREREVERREWLLKMDDDARQLELARHHLKSLEPMTGTYLGVPLDRFTAEEVLKIWKETNRIWRHMPPKPI